jgi:DNA-binding transcriptional regulator YiaG
MTPSDLIAFRLSLGLSITAMAERLNTPRSSYIKWERGERRVPGIVEVAIKHVKPAKS